MLAAAGRWREVKSSRQPHLQSSSAHGMRCVHVAILQSHREAAYCCVSLTVVLVVVTDASDKAASRGMLPRRRRDATSASKLKRRCRLRLCTLPTSCMLQLRWSCVFATHTHTHHVALCRLYFQNPHEENT